MFILRVDDIGRTPLDDPQAGTDFDLEYFREWRDMIGARDLNVLYGAVPEWVSAKALEEIKPLLGPGEKFAIHGRDHKHGAVLSEEDYVFGYRRLSHAGNDVWATIPPFNSYDDEDICRFANASWKECLQSGYFFGGFHGEHHHHGHWPKLLGDQRKAQAEAIHVPAFRSLYGRANDVRAKMAEMEDIQVPLVATLHIGWDTSPNALRDFGAAARRSCVELCEIDRWLERAKYNVRDMQGAAFVAAKFVLDQLKIGDEYLDVGARYSHLPSLAAVHGAKVNCIDTTQDVHEWQKRLADQRSVQLKSVMVGDAASFDFGDRKYDVISACWAIQHNLEREKQSIIASRLAGMLNPGGRLVVVSSLAPEKSFEQAHRADPQLVLDAGEHDKVIIKASGLRIDSLCKFSYIHQRPEYELNTSSGNAICYVLTRDQN